jgi:hypothetical protein
MSFPRVWRLSSYYDLTTQAVIPQGAWEHTKFNLGQEKLYGATRWKAACVMRVLVCL